MARGLVNVNTDTGSHQVELDTEMSVWDVLGKIQKADPNMQIRYIGPNGQGGGLTVAQARDTFVAPGGRITQTPKGINAA